MTFSPLGTNPVRADYMDFIYSFWTAYTTVVYRKPNAENKVKLYIKPFKYEVKSRFPGLALSHREIINSSPLQ